MSVLPVAYSAGACAVGVVWIWWQHHSSNTAHSARRRLKLCQMGEIALTLLRSPVVTRLILRTHQAVGTAATVGHQVQVAAAPPDRLLQVTAPSFRGLKNPMLAVGIRQEAAEFAAMRTRASDSARPGPIAWRLQR